MNHKIQAKQSGAQVQLVRTAGKKILSCTGCFGCSHSREKGGDGRCVIKDNLHEVEDAILDADGVIVVAPVYSVGPSGQLKCMIDRMGLSRDRAFADLAREKLLAEGKDPAAVLDMRVFKDRFLGLVSVGGAADEGWTAMGLPNMHLLSFSMQMPVVDHLNVYDMNVRVHPVLDNDLLERANRLGRNVAEAVGTPKYQAAWKGDKPGVCPACHNDLLQITGGLDVACPVCGVRGTLEIRDGKPTISCPPHELERSRMRYGGIREHMEELIAIPQRIPKDVLARVDTIPELMKRYDALVD